MVYTKRWNRREGPQKDSFDYNSIPTKTPIQWEKKDPPKGVEQIDIPI